MIGSDTLGRTWDEYGLYISSVLSFEEIITLWHVVKGKSHTIVKKKEVKIVSPSNLCAIFYAAFDKTKLRNLSHC